jgi:hypothetical protein
MESEVSPKNELNFDLGFDLGIDNSRFGKTKKNKIKTPAKKMKTVKKVKVESMDLSTKDLMMSGASEDKKVSRKESLGESGSDTKSQPIQGFKNSVSELDMNSSSVSKKSHSSNSSTKNVTLIRNQQNAGVRRNETR